MSPRRTTTAEGIRYARAGIGHDNDGLTDGGIDDPDCVASPSFASAGARHFDEIQSSASAIDQVESAPSSTDAKRYKTNSSGQPRSASGELRRLATSLLSPPDRAEHGHVGTHRTPSRHGMSLRQIQRAAVHVNESPAPLIPIHVTRRHHLAYAGIHDHRPRLEELSQTRYFSSSGFRIEAPSVCKCNADDDDCGASCVARFCGEQCDPSRCPAGVRHTRAVCSLPDFVLH